MSNSQNARPLTGRRDDRQRAVVTKLTSAHYDTGTHDRDGKKTLTNTNTALFNQVSDHTAGLVNDYDSMRQLLPDLDHGAEILVSSVLSPKDLSEPKIKILSNSTKLTPEAINKLLAVIEDYFYNDYNINSKLRNQVTEALINRGAYIRMVIPESSLDNIINGGREISLEDIMPYAGHHDSLTAKPIGILGPSKSTSGGSLESLFTTPALSTADLTLESANKQGSPINSVSKYVTVTDNPNVLKMPSVLNRIRQQKTSRVLSKEYTSLESVAEVKQRKRDDSVDKQNSEDKPLKNSPIYKSVSKLSDSEIIKNVDNGREFISEHVVEVKTKHHFEKGTVGHPLVMNLPVEAVIPAYVPGSPEEHIGYFVLLDQHGNPINSSMAVDHYNSLKSAFNSNTSAENNVSAITNELRNTWGGSSADSPVDNLMQATTLFADITEKNLLERIRSGTGNMSTLLAKPTGFYQTMLARALSKKQTQLLYVPVELMSYQAFDYSHNGIGKSLLESTRVLGGMRVLLMFANAMNNVRNATPRTELAITLDPNDADPLHTIGLVKEAFAQSRQEGFPIGSGRPEMAIDYMRNASIDTVYSGHEDLPDMKVESNEKNQNRTTLGTEIEEDYKHRHQNGLGLSPELVDASQRVDYATTITHSSLMLAKKVLSIQIIFEDKESSFIRKYTDNSETLLSSLLDVAEAMSSAEKGGQSDVEIVRDFIKSIYVELPKPDTITLKAQMEAYEEMSRALDSILDAWISDDFAMMDADGDIAGLIREFRAAYKSQQLRKYMYDNNILPELLATTERDKEGKLLFDFSEEHSQHMNTILEGMQNYIDKAKAAQAKRIENSNELTRKLNEKHDLKKVELGEGQNDSEDTSNDSSGRQDNNLDFDEFGNDGDEESNSDDSQNDDREDDVTEIDSNDSDNDKNDNKSDADDVAADDDSANDEDTNG